VNDVPPDRSGDGTSLVGLVRRAVALGAAVLVTRGELAALELTDARQRAFRWLAMALVAAVLLLAALLTGAVLVAAIFWETYRWQALVALMALYAVGGAVFTAVAAAELRAAPPLLSATLDELKQDCDALRAGGN
jgi:uncharacterized membrane protein YqjE